MNSYVLKLEISIEKIPEEGEDAEPLLRLFGDENQSGVVGVFDGLGGAGSTVYESTNAPPRTGAYYASRMAKNATEENFVQFEQTHEPEAINAFVTALKAKLVVSLKEASQELKTSPSKLRSSLIKQFPTTMAVTYFCQSAEKDQYYCIPMWAGDSRCYALSPTIGLQQLTCDDLRLQGDAMENLIEDSPLSNCINADVDFELHHQIIALNAPCAFLSATDGCFGYLPTPMHFEFLLLSTLQEATNEQRWKEILTAHLQQIAGDDASMALAGVGWEDFSSFRQDLRDRTIYVFEEYVAPLREIEEHFERLTRKLDECTIERERRRAELWLQYKPYYAQHEPPHAAQT